MQLKNALLAGVAVMAMASCGQPGGENKAEVSRKLLDPANIDTTVRPGDNFFQYANGAWLKSNPIPKSKTRWGSFNELDENNNNVLRQLLDSAVAVKDAAKGSNMQMVGDFYRTGMDSMAIENAGMAPLGGILGRIDAIKDVNSLMAEVALEHTQGIGQLFSFSVSPDDKNVTKEMCQFGHGGLGMPGRGRRCSPKGRSRNFQTGAGACRVFAHTCGNARPLQAVQQIQ